MTQQPTTEERLALLESRVAELEAARRDQDTVAGALLVRIDSFIGDMHRLEREQRSGFDALLMAQNGMRQEMNARFERVESAVVSLAEVARDHKAAIEDVAEQVQGVAVNQQVLQSGEQSIQAALIDLGGQVRNMAAILDLLTGELRRHD